MYKEKGIYLGYCFKVLKAKRSRTSSSNGFMTCGIMAETQAEKAIW